MARAFLPKDEVERELREMQAAARRGQRPPAGASPSVRPAAKAQQVQQPATPPQPQAAAAVPPAAAAPPSPASYAALAKGTTALNLSNLVGENNCFLNVSVQALWHLKPFREAILSSPPPASSGKDAQVLRALRDIFLALQQHIKGGQQAGGQPSVLAPTALRDALNARFGDAGLFKHGEMNDASEALGSILECLDEASKGEADSFVRRVFAINIEHSLHCPHCAAVTHSGAQHRLTEVVQTAVLCAAAPLGLSLTDVLRIDYATDERSCDQEQGGCGVRGKLKYTIRSGAGGRPELPECYTVLVGWHTESASLQDLRNCLKALQQEIDLRDVYDGLGGPSGEVPERYLLRAVVCYYGERCCVHASSRRTEHRNDLGAPPLQACTTCATHSMPPRGHGSTTMTRSPGRSEAGATWWTQWYAAGSSPCSYRSPRRSRDMRFANTCADCY